MVSLVFEALQGCVSVVNVEVGPSRGCLLCILCAGRVLQKLAEPRSKFFELWNNVLTKSS
jgi:hypothetical protein